MKALVLSSSALLASSLMACTVSQPRETTTSIANMAEPVEHVSTVAPADRKALFGDLHLHTSLSLDSYVLMGTRTTLDEAYRFARGEKIAYLGLPVQRREPLDFLAITDHSENLADFTGLGDAGSAISQTDLGRRVNRALSSGRLGTPEGPQGAEAVSLVGELFSNVMKALVRTGPAKEGKLAGIDVSAMSRTAWRRSIEAANRYYQPGKFTTFVAYEWTSSVDQQNLHRNVIFRGNDAPAVFSSAESLDPEDLWAYLARIRAKGYEALAIPHNSNGSNGLMYDWTKLNGRPIDADYARTRREYEPLAEIVQVKGTSETHPALSPNDEFASFELFDHLLSNNAPSKPAGSYLRDALSRGMALQQSLGVNPYQFGFVGASDLHSGLSASAEEDNAGDMGRLNMGGGRPTQEEARRNLRENIGFMSKGLGLSSAGLTGVWAEENTRSSIYSALRRRETFATSGTRLQLRFFAGWNLPAGLQRRHDWVWRAYSSGVPMGSDLAKRPASARTPSFVVWARKDPDGANLDRIQVVKLWTDLNGERHERIFDVAYQRGRPHDAKGRLSPIGDTVDSGSATYRNSIGSTELLASWRDPAFNPKYPAAYYIRVLEIPTPRWSTILAAKQGLNLPEEARVSIQERGWSSPIWYTP